MTKTLQKAATMNKAYIWKSSIAMLLERIDYGKISVR